VTCSHPGAVPQTAPTHSTAVEFSSNDSPHVLAQDGVGFNHVEPESITDYVRETMAASAQVVLVISTGLRRTR